MSSKGERRSRGLRGPCTPRQGMYPLHPSRRENKLGRENSLRLPRWGLRKFEGFWPKKAGKIPGGKFTFPWGLFPGFPRMRSIRVGGSFRRLNRRKSAQRTLLVSPDLTADEIPATGGHRRFVRRARSTTAPSLTSVFLQATAGTKFGYQCKQNPPLRVQGGHHPGGAWGETPA